MVKKYKALPLGLNKCLFKQRFDNGQSVWKAKHAEYPNFSAISEAPLGSMLLGPHRWTIYNDSTFCSADQGHTAAQALSPAKTYTR